MRNQSRDMMLCLVVLAANRFWSLFSVLLWCTSLKLNLLIKLLLAIKRLSEYLEQNGWNTKGLGLGLDKVFHARCSIPKAVNTSIWKQVEETSVGVSVTRHHRHSSDYQTHSGSSQNYFLSEVLNNDKLLFFQSVLWCKAWQHSHTEVNIHSISFP